MKAKSSSQSGEQSKRGFAAMSKNKQKEIAKKGGEHSLGGGRPASVKGKNTEE